MIHELTSDECRTVMARVTLARLACSHSDQPYIVPIHCYYDATPDFLYSIAAVGQRGATLAIAVAVGFAVWNTTRYHGPFVFDSITLSVLSTQLYIAVAALSTLSMAALVSERKRFATRLDASHADVIQASVFDDSMNVAGLLLSTLAVAVVSVQARLSSGMMPTSLPSRVTLKG